MRRDGAAPEFVTVGHSRHPLEAFVGLLECAGVCGLIDVRRFPGSRLNPQFNRGTLEKRLAERGIGYSHVESLGGRRQGLEGGHSANGAWRLAPFRAYADYALTSPFQGALAALLASATERPAALMCAEADWRRCHRRILADHLLARGKQIAHLLPDATLEVATLPASARIGADGLVRYPAPAAQLRLQI